MGYYAILAGTDQHPLASTMGWRDFKDWVDLFGDDDFLELKHLIDHGWSQHLQELLHELGQLAATNPQRSVASTITDLIATIHAAPKGAVTIHISDGSVASDRELVDTSVAHYEPRPDDSFGAHLSEDDDDADDNGNYDYDPES